MFRRGKFLGPLTSFMFRYILSALIVLDSSGRADVNFYFHP